MAKQLQIRGGTTEQHNTFTGASREITIDTSKNTVVVHDGYTPGGFPLAKESSVALKVAKVTSADNAIVRFDGTTGAVQNSGVTIDDNGNVGIGVTPSAWRTTSKAVQLGASGSIESLTNNGSYVSLNANNYNNGSNDIYINTAAVTKYLQLLGTHRWYTAPSGTAGNPITWTEVMTLSSNGNLLVGTTTDNGVDKLQVNGSIVANAYSGAISEFNGYTPVLNNTNNSFAGSSYFTASINDLNNLVRSGTYNCTDIANSPVPGWIFVQHMQHSDFGSNNWAQQIVTTMGASGNIPNQMYIRTKVGGVWTPWVEK